MAAGMFLLPEGIEDQARNCLYDSETCRWWTFGALREEVIKLATTLSSPKKCLVFCYCSNHPGSVIEYLASIQAGHAVALLDSKSTPEVRKSLTDLYQPDILFDTANDLGSSAGNRDYMGPEDGGNRHQLFRRRHTNDLPPINKDLATLLTTSGSTGSPKFVRLSRKNVESNARSISIALKLNPQERAISSLPIHYSYGLSVLNSHLLSTGSVVLTNLSPLERPFWDLFREHGCTSLAGVPFQYQLLDRIGFADMELPTLKTMTQAGGRLANETITKFHDLLSCRGARLVVMYGQTEATARMTCLPPDQLRRKLGSVGLPILGGEVKIKTEAGLTTRANCKGEIVYSGPNVMMGYATSRQDLMRGEETDAILYTGDIGYLDQEGFLYITGRRQRISKLFGLRINLDDVEQMLNENGPVAVVGDDEKILVFCEYGNEKIYDQYSRKLARTLKVPQQVFTFRYLESIPLTSSGKIDYKKLEVLP